MKKRFFQFEERVAYMHSVEVEISPEQEDDYADFCCEVAEKMENGEYDDPAEIAAAFKERFGEDNVVFCEDASPDADFEAI